MRDHIVKYGLFVSGFQIGLTLILYVMGPEVMSNWWVGIASFVISLVICVMGIMNYKKLQEGYLAFKEAFTLAFGILMVAAVIGVLFNGLLYNVIDPELSEELTEIAIQNTVEMMEKFGSPESEIDKQVEKLNQGVFTFSAQLKNLIWAVPITAIFALILAAFLKKKRPEILD